MKRIILIVLVAMTASCQWASGQSFSYTAPVTEMEAHPGLLTQFYSEIHNYDADTLHYWIVMDTTFKPPGWSVNFCTGLYCWPPWVIVDSGAVVPGNGMDSILVDIYADDSAPEGWITMTVFPDGQPELAQSITFHAYVLGTGQYFSYTAEITEKTGQPGQLTQFYSELANLDTVDITFWIEMHTDVPPGWNVNFCTGSYCWPPWITLDTNAVILAGQTDSVLVDIYPDSVGLEGWVTMVVYPEGHSEVADSITFYAYVPDAVEESISVPIAHEMLGAYPNPFNPAVRIGFSTLRPGFAELDIYDLSGRHVCSLLNSAVLAGPHQISWRPEGEAAGIYLARLRLDGVVTTQKIVYLR